jgi:hypothetical protein
MAMQYDGNSDTYYDDGQPDQGYPPASDFAVTPDQGYPPASDFAVRSPTIYDPVQPPPPPGGGGAGGEPLCGRGDRPLLQLR